MFRDVQFYGWTTKKKPKLIEIPNANKVNDPDAEDMSFCFVTLMQDRDYKVIQRDAAGKVIMEDDGKTPKRDYPTDAISLKFRNGSSKSLIANMTEGVSRKLRGIGHIETFQTKENYIMVDDTANPGKLVKRELFYTDPTTHQRVDILHTVTHTVIMVDGWEFADSNPNAKTDVNNGIVADPNAGIEGFAPVGAEGIPAIENELPPVEGATTAAPQPAF